MDQEKASDRSMTTIRPATQGEQAVIWGDAMRSVETAVAAMRIASYPGSAADLMPYIGLAEEALANLRLTVSRLSLWGRHPLPVPHFVRPEEKSAAR